MQFLRAGIDFSLFENVREMNHSKPIFECLNKLSQHLDNENKTEDLVNFIDNAKCNASIGCDRCGIKMMHIVIRILRPFILKTYLRRFRDLYV